MRAAVVFFILAAATQGLAQETAANHSLKPLPKNEWDAEKAAHLLARAGFGGSAEQIEKLGAMGLDEAVNFLVDYQTLPYEAAPPLIPETLYERPDRSNACTPANARSRKSSRCSGTDISRRLRRK
ncbi:MAG: hypothetical protein HZB38_10410 [Planctomycetes bacterium]|nr:hypothetical protein [Planctomycetota bacterium]